MGLGEPKTILVRFEMALSPSEIVRSQRVLGAQNLIFGDYGRALRSRKRVFGTSEKVLVVVTIFLGHLTGPW